jgi:hypothetical protein
MDAGGHHFFCGDATDAFDHFGVPTASHGQLGGKNVGALPKGMTVDAIFAKKQGNAQTILSGHAHGFAGFLS